MEKKTLRIIKWIWGHSRGVTLLEVMLAVTVFSLIMAALLTFYSGGLQSWARGSATIDIQQNARIAMFEIINELRYAAAVEGLEDNNILPLYHPGVAQQQGAGSLSFTSADGQKCKLIYNETKRVITLKIGSGSGNEIAYHAAGLDFFRYVPPGITPGEYPESISQMILVILQIREQKGESAAGSPFVLQNTVRLQNLSR
ncbi:MAG: prepilin-type N-terminal cleavage/methylation domain-containing protein [Bacillota bacterium]|nr:prepilin-type N-terminal cleavage/methylation domain-containing protein [Bacillota bacterium]